jgi:putative membrane protein
MLLIWRGSVLPKILPQLIITTLLAVAVTITHGQLGSLKLTLTAIPFSLIGVALAVFLGFRNNASYERYWEARKIWGALLNDGRSFARQVQTLLRSPAPEKRRLVLLGVAFVHTLRHQLRQTDPSSDLARLLGQPDLERASKARFKPAVVLVIIGEGLSAARERGELDPILANSMESTLGGLSHVLGGCERISNTPIPFTYSVIIHRIVYLYCFLLPFGLVDSIGFMTPLIVAFISYTFFALEALSDEIEEPFGTMPNDLALNAMSLTIEETMREIIGDESPMPPIPAAVDYVIL